MSEPATETPEQAQEKPKRTSSTTKYIVLAKDNSGYWHEAGLFDARSAKEAVRAHLDKEEVEAGTFVAVPVRSFEAVTVKTETVARRMFT